MTLPTMNFQFDDFQLFPMLRLLLRAGAKVPIGSRALDILIALVERAGEVVTKKELLERAWPQLNVEDSSLRVHIGALRKALCDGRGATSYIVNVTGRGYSFAYAVEKMPQTVFDRPVLASPSSDFRGAMGLFGRGKDRETTNALLIDKRFVTIHGPGGVGKTALARCVAEDFARRPKARAYFIDLSECSVASVETAIFTSLGLETRGAAMGSNLIDFLSLRETVLVFDGCEHVTEAVATIAERLWRAIPTVHLLATSREPLLAAAEQVLRLKPLCTPPENLRVSPGELSAFAATRLFVERVQATGYDLPLADVDAWEISEICRRSEGAPLALELAAGQVDKYGLSYVRQHIGSREQLVWSGRRTAPIRHRTLQAMVQWSYDLLDGPQRLLLQRLATLEGSFTLAQARTATTADGGREDASEILAQLVLKSLVVVEPSDFGQNYRLPGPVLVFAKSRQMRCSKEVGAHATHTQYCSPHSREVWANS